MASMHPEHYGGSSTSEQSNTASATSIFVKKIVGMADTLLNAKGFAMILGKEVDRDNGPDKDKKL